MLVNALQRRHEFVVFFDVKNGNPNGDPDGANMPRVDHETGHGLITDVCLKRKIRNYVETVKGDAPGYRIYVSEDAVLNEKHREAYQFTRPLDKTVATAKRLSPRNVLEAEEIRSFMCERFFDIRTFGGVLRTGINAGQVRGPVQLGFAQSVEPIFPLEITITRMAATSENDTTEPAGRDGSSEQESARGLDKRTFGRKYIVPYGLYRVHGFVSAPLASDHRKGTGFNDDDLSLLLDALAKLFEHDRSSSRGEMATRRLIVFRHATALGNARAQDLFTRVKAFRHHQGRPVPIGDALLAELKPARSFEDYVITLDSADMPNGVEMLDMS